MLLLSNCVLSFCHENKFKFMVTIVQARGKIFFCCWNLFYGNVMDDFVCHSLTYRTALPRYFGKELSLFLVRVT